MAKIVANPAPKIVCLEIAADWMGLVIVNRVLMEYRVNLVQLVNMVPDVSLNVQEVVRTESVINEMEPVYATKVLMEVNATFVKWEATVNTVRNVVKRVAKMEYVTLTTANVNVCLDLAG